MTDKMTLDELIEALMHRSRECDKRGERKLANGDEHGEVLERVFSMGFSQSAAFVRANRAELEAGMRGTLRFKWDDGYWWCQECRQEVGAAFVTHKHDTCGHTVEWIIPARANPEPEPTSCIPEGYKAAECYESETEYVIVGDPPDDSEHDCDEMGCTAVSHVLARISKPLTPPTGDVGELLENVESILRGYEERGDKYLDKLRTAVSALERERDKWRDIVMYWRSLGAKAMIALSCAHEEEIVSSIETLRQNRDKAVGALSELLTRLPKHDCLPVDKTSLDLRCRYCGAIKKVDELPRWGRDYCTNPDCPAVRARAMEAADD